MNRLNLAGFFVAAATAIASPLHFALAQDENPIVQTAAQPAQGQAASEKWKPPPRPGGPREQISQDLHGFVAAINSRTFSAATTYVMDARIGYYGANEWSQYWNEKLVLEHVVIDDIKDDKADVTVVYCQLPHGNERTPDMSETLQLQRQGPLKNERYAYLEGAWRIVVGQPDVEFAKGPLSLNRLAFFIQQAPGTLDYIRADESLRRLAALGAGAMRFIDDWDATYAFDPQYVGEALAPYTKDQRLFTVPGTNESYTFNGALSGQDIAKIADPARTVLFYEGHNEQPTYRYNGKAALCFVDGHAALVTPDDAKTLPWGH